MGAVDCPNANPNAHGYSIQNADVDPNAHRYSIQNANMDPNAYGHPVPNTDVDFNAHGHPDQNAHMDADAYSHPDGNMDAYHHTDRYTHADLDPSDPARLPATGNVVCTVYAHAYFNAHTHRDANSHATTATRGAGFVCDHPSWQQSQLHSQLGRGEWG